MDSILDADHFKVRAIQNIHIYGIGGNQYNIYINIDGVQHPRKTGEIRHCEVFRKIKYIFSDAQYCVNSWSKLMILVSLDASKFDAAGYIFLFLF